MTNDPLWTFDSIYYYFHQQRVDYFPLDFRTETKPDRQLSIFLKGKKIRKWWQCRIEKAITLPLKPTKIVSKIRSTAKPMVTFLSCEYHLLNYFQVVEVFSLVLQEQTIKNLQLSILPISIYILQLDHPEKDYQKTKKTLAFLPIYKRKRW